MSTAAGVSLDQYLSTHYEPECELIGGELIQKPMGTTSHGRAQLNIAIALSRYKTGGLIVAPEVSILHGDDVRIPDVIVYRSGAKLYRDILDEPPLLCVEIVSPSQNPSVLFAKCENYHAWGVPFCWVIDPVKKAAWEYHPAIPLNHVSDALHAGHIEVALAEIFGQPE